MCTVQSVTGLITINLTTHRHMNKFPRYYIQKSGRRAYICLFLWTVKIVSFLAFSNSSFLSVWCVFASIHYKTMEVWLQYQLILCIFYLTDKINLWTLWKQNPSICLGMAWENIPLMLKARNGVPSNFINNFYMQLKFHFITRSNLQLKLSLW